MHTDTFKLELLLYTVKKKKKENRRLIKEYKMIYVVKLKSGEHEGL